MKDAKEWAIEACRSNEFLVCTGPDESSFIAFIRRVQADAIEAAALQLVGSTFMDKPNVMETVNTCIGLIRALKPET